MCIHRAAGPAHPVRVAFRARNPYPLSRGIFRNKPQLPRRWPGLLGYITMRQILILTLVALCAAFVRSACSNVDQGAMKRSLYVDQHPELPATMADAIRDGQITVGMTQEMVQVAWGKPVRMGQVTQLDAASEWTYGNYFMGGNITNLYFDSAGLLVRYEVNYQPASANGGNVAIQNPNQPGDPSGTDGNLNKSGGQP